MSENTTDNMHLWNQVCKTDPKHTKQVNYGKRKFTDVDAQWLRQRATELWGPYGSAWGLKGVEYQVLPVQFGDGIVNSLIMKAMFWYPSGEFEIVNDMKYDPSGECMKKLHTNTLSKALSFLGFSADVYLGQFDDSRYVAEMDRHFRSEERGKNGKQTAKGNSAQSKSTTWDDVRERAAAAVAGATTANDCSSLLDKFVKTFESAPDDVYNAPLRLMVVRLNTLVDEEKVDERAASALMEVIRGRIRNPTEHDKLKQEAAGVF